ncbi:MAG: hypothetical protein ACK40G_17315 [Cytophagaceae bacterium]
MKKGNIVYRGYTIELVKGKKGITSKIHRNGELKFEDKVISKNEKAAEKRATVAIDNALSGLSGEEPKALTFDNYFNYFHRLGIDSLPEGLRSGHDFLFKNKGEYHSNEVIRETIQDYLNDINEYIKSLPKSAQGKIFKGEDKGYSGRKFTGNKYKNTQDLDIKEIAKLVREELNILFEEEGKFSVTIDRYSGGQSLSVKITDLNFDPFSELYSKHLKANDRWDEYRNEHNNTYPKIYNERAEKLMSRIKKIVDQYNFDDSDSMIDYFHVNFYSSVRIEDSLLIKKFYPENKENNDRIKWSEEYDRKAAERNKKAAERRGKYPKNSYVMYKTGETRSLLAGEYRARILKSPNGRATFSLYTIEFFVDKIKKNGVEKEVSPPHRVVFENISESQLSPLKNEDPRLKQKFKKGEKVVFTLKHPKKDFWAPNNPAIIEPGDYQVVIDRVIAGQYPRYIFYIETQKYNEFHHKYFPHKEYFEVSADQLDPVGKKKITPPVKPEKPKQKSSINPVPVKEKPPVPAKEKPKPESILVNEISESVKLIRRYAAFHDKEKPISTILNLIKAIQRAITKKIIRKSDKYASEIISIQEKLVMTYNDYSDQEKLKIQINEADLSRLVAISGGESVYPSIGLIKRFITMEGKKASQEQIKSFIAAASKIQNEDPYYSKIQSLIRLLSKIKSGGIVKVESSELNGIYFIVNSFPEEKNLQIKKKEKKALKVDPMPEPVKTELSGAPDQAGTGLFLPFDQLENIRDKNKKLLSFRLPGYIGKILGDLERYELAITLEGDQGSGKTRLTYQLANAFADAGFNVGIWSLEIGIESNLIRKMRDEYIDPKNMSNVKGIDQERYKEMTGKRFDGINTIREHANDMDVWIIDSFGKLECSSQELDKLRKDYPNTIWIPIFQRTSGKVIRGGTAPLFDAGINLEVVKQPDHKDNYAYASKNRYGETGIKYSIFNKSIIE